MDYLNTKNTKFLLMCFLILLSKTSYSFPYMVKHGYTTCMTCHFNPSGGGLLTSYGKFVAGELFGRYNDSETALKWITEPEDEKLVHVGGFLRAAQSYFNTASVKRGKFERMQADLELVLTKGPYFAEVSGGMRGTSARANQNETDLKIRTFYAGARSEAYAVRAGRFFPEFGLRTPNHNVPTRKGAFWNQGDEPYLFQASWLSPVWDFTIGYVEGAPETQLADKKGYLSTVSYKTGHSRTGVSYIDASNSDSKSQATSLFTTIGHEDVMYLLAEVMRKNVTVFGTGANPNQTTTASWLSSIEAGYEVSKGIFPYFGLDTTITTSISQLNGTSPDSRIYSVPLGIKFYPYTHFEVQAQYSLGQQINSSKTSSLEAALFMLNIYF